MKKTLLKSTFVVSFMTITSRITGFLRDLIFAHVFGATAGLDVFIVAFRIPNFMRRMFAEGAFSQAFVPVLAEYREKRSPDEVQTFINRMAGAIFTIVFIITVIAVLITPVLVWIFAPGFVHDPTRYNLATAMLRITFPYLIFISLTAFLGGILNTYGRFSVPAFTPNILNLALIGAAIFFAPYFEQPVKALAWGVFIGGIVQVLFQLPFVRRIHLLPRPKIFWRDSGVRRVIKLMGPAIFGVSVVQISLLIDTIFATFLRTGSVTWLYFSDRLNSFPLGVFGVAIATVILPHLSRKHAHHSAEEFSQTVDWALRSIFLIALPAMLGLLLLAGPILTTLLEYGKFTAFDVIMTRKSLIAFALGMPAFMLVKILAAGFYARQDIKTPVRIAVIVMIINVFLDAALIFPLAHAGLALATTLTSTLNAALLCWTLLKRKLYRPSKGWLKFACQLLFANGALTLLLMFGSASLPVWLSRGSWERVWHLGVLLSAAMLLYFACLWLSGIRLKHFLLRE